jgi:hypothetical protein
MNAQQSGHVSVIKWSDKRISMYHEIETRTVSKRGKQKVNLYVYWITTCIWVVPT